VTLTGASRWRRGRTLGVDNLQSGVEAALAVALERASAAGRWDVVAQLARELEARRLAREPNVVVMTADRGRAGRS
jgi:hypothetical protein